MLHPDRTAYVFLADGEHEAARLTYAQADIRARAIAVELRRRGAEGERVLVSYPSESGLDYVTSVLGCFYAGAIAVPCDAPHGRSGRERLRWIAGDAQPRLLLKPAADEVSMEAVLPERPGHLDVGDVPDALAAHWRPPELTGGSLAMLQYTSGSTRNPRGVMISHGNVLANERAIEAACRNDEHSVFVGWLPLFHDMGMIANVLQPIYLGSMSVLMPPRAFVASPHRWLAAVSRYGGVTSGGPNFAYDLCVARIDPARIASLDLSSWRSAFNGAEVVRSDTLRRFTAAFAAAGFAPETFFPCYGLAEATLIVTGAPRGELPLRFHADPAALADRRLAPATEASRTLVSSGRVVPDTIVQIVDPQTGQPIPDGRLGEVWVSGPGVAGGYRNRPAETAAVFGGVLPDHGAARFLRTGDLGGLRDGELFVVGRLKDMIIVRGQNIYPDDVEHTAERSHGALRPSCGAAFSVDDGEQERLVVVFETSVAHPDIVETAAALRRSIAREHRVEVSTVVLVEPGRLPKTTSGKVRRESCRRAFLAGSLSPVGVHEFSVDRPPDPLAALPSALAALPEPRRRSTLSSALLVVVLRAAGLDPRSVGLRTDTPFSAVGLDSLAAVTLQHRLQDEFGVELEPLALVGDQTADGLAHRLLAGRRILPVPEPADESSGPLSSVQAAVWFDHQLAPPGPAYTLVRALQVDGDVDADRIGAAVERLVSRHPALRTHIELRDGVPVQVVGAGNPLLHERLPARSGALAERLAAEHEAGFVPVGRCLVRLTLLRPTASEQVFVIAAHHAVADFWSLVVIVRELLADLADTPAPALPRTSPIAHARREQSRSGSAEDGRRLRYWRDRLRDAPDLLDLPRDRPVPATRSFVGAVHTIGFAPRLGDRIRELAQAQGTTPFTVVLTALQVLLSRHSGRNELVVGALTAGRDDSVLADVVGCFANPVPIRVRIDPAESFAELLARHRLDVLTDLRHEIPFVRLVRELDPARHPGRPVLVQAMLAYQQEHGPPDDGLRALALGRDAPLRRGRVAAASVGVTQPWSHLDLTLHVARIDGELAGHLEYATSAFDAGTAAALGNRLAALLSDLCNRPDLPLDAIPAMDIADRAAAVAVGRGPRVPRRPGRGLHTLVLERGAAEPDAVAVAALRPDGTSEQLTYATLDRWSADLAARLSVAGAGPESVIAVVLERSVALPVALLGVLRCGAAFLPLDPADPPARRAAVMADAGVLLAICSDGIGLPDGVVRVRAEPGQPVPVLAAVPVHDEQAAYVLYTSGSTGWPKGVVVAHGAIVNRIDWMQEALTLTGVDRVLHKTPTTFDVALWELFWPLATGACLVLAPPGAQRDPVGLAAVLRSQEVTVVHFVPTLLTAFLAGTGPGPLAALEVVVCSGEALPARLRDRFHRDRRTALWNLYGPTEAAVDVTAWRCSPTAHGAPPIGLPIANTDVHVFGAAGELVPTGVPGELSIGGVAPARGYLGRPGATAAAFVPDPLAERPGRRRYRTGDRGRVRPDGALDFLGRHDDQVKLSGNRIELGEVAEALRRLPDVRDAAAVVHDDGTGPRLVGYVAGYALDADALTDLLRTELPPAMVPARIVALDALPLTVAGKLDRHALPDPAAVVPRPDPAGAPVVQRIAAVWAEVLGPGPSAASDIDVDWFAAGGDSILAIRLVAGLRTAGLDLTVADLVNHRTVRGLARVATESGAAVEPPPPPWALCPPHVRAAVPDGVEDAYPISSAQQAVLFQQMHDPRHETYVTSLRVRGALGVDAMREAVAALLDRHPYLRSSFDLRADRIPMQFVHAGAPTPFDVVDLTRLDHAECDGVVEDWLRAERKRPIDVHGGSLARFTVHRRSTVEFQLTVCSFALDGWCTATVLTEVLVDHAARLGAGSAPIPRPATDYREFVALERAACGSAEHRAFWAAELADARPSLVPGSPDPGAASLTRRTEVAFDPGVATRLVRLARELAVPLRSVLLAAHVRVVGVLTGRREVVTALEMHGRPEVPGGDRVVGVFNNIVPLRIIRPGRTWADLVTAADEAERRVTPHRRYPLAQIEREHRVRALFNTLFVFTDFHAYRQVAAVDGVDVVDAVAPDRTYVPLTTHATIDPFSGELKVLLDHDPTEVPDGTATLYAELLRAALADLADRPDGPVEATGLLSPTWTRRLVELGTGSRPAHDDRSVVDMMTAQAARRPDAVAVAQGSVSLTYAGLVRRATLLGAALQDAGVATDDLVAVPGVRGTDLVVAVLATWWAGAGYLPIDPAAPVSVTRDALAAAGARFVVGPPEFAQLLPHDGRAVPVHAEGTPRGRPARHADALAYCLPTSGTSGRPKLVGISNGAVANYLRWCRTSYGFEDGGRTPVHSPVAFDLTVTSLLGPLVAGGTVELLDPDSGPEALAGPLGRGIDLLKITPDHLGALGRARQPHPDAPRVRCLVVGGAALLRDVLPAWDVGTVVNEYGPTEATVGCCAHRLAPGDDEDPVPIGRPVAGAVAHVLHAGHPVPVDVEGELCVGGAGLARGYLGQPGATAGVFVPSPFVVGARLYRTGDRARVGPDGLLRFVGRLDRQAKIRGVRIEPGGIEAVLLRHPSVAAAAVAVVAPRPAGRSVLAAYWVSRAPGSSSDDVRAWLADRLLPHHVPDVVVELPALPLTRRGKVDLAALPDPTLPRRTILLALAEHLSSAAAHDLLGARSSGS